MAAVLTLGVEEELHLVDPTTSLLAARAPQLLAGLPPESFGAELQRTTVETNTAVQHSLSDLRADIVALRSRLVQAADREGLVVAAVGTPPLSSAEDFELTASGRFGRMQQDYRLLVDEQLICGLQVHVGLADRDVAVQVTQRIGADLPVLLALSASSPYWRAADTGYSSIRTIIWQRWPSAGATGPLRSAAEYDDLLADLISSGVIADAKMAYFDVRPSAHAPTVELRVCDACPLVDDAIGIAGLFRAMVSQAEQATLRGDPFTARAAPLHRAAMWRAARSGLVGDLLDFGEHPAPVPAAQAVNGLLRRLRPQLEELGDWDTVQGLVGATLARGSSADRQRAALAERGELKDVVALVVAETHGQLDGQSVLRAAPRSYRARAGDEAFTANGEARPAYRELFGSGQGSSLLQLADRAPARDQWATEHGMTFGVDGMQRPFPVDLLPRIVPGHEWAQLTEGLIQRARAIEAFLADAYGPAQLVKDGVLSLNTLHRSPGWRQEGTRLPPGVVRAPVMGFDLVRNELGNWRVLEDNVRVPSGAAYAVAMRELMDAVAPDLARPAGLLDPHSALRQLAGTLRAAARTRGEPAVALLSDGAGNSAWFEHRLLAERAGLLLLQPGEVVVQDEHVLTRDGRVVDVLYLRLDVEVVDLQDEQGRDVGAQIFAAAAAGAVSLANAPGNGLADDKSMYCYLPDIISYYLGERPKLAGVPTYRCADPDERRAVLERVGELVTKPIDGYGGGGVLIGPNASASEVAQRRREIDREPAGWVAQELVLLSSHPTFDGHTLEPRHVDLRAFVYVTGTGAEDVQVADVALTRVAPAGSMVVNSSRGGGAKDTWIVAGGAGQGRPVP